MSLPLIVLIGIGLGLVTMLMLSGSGNRRLARRARQLGPDRVGRQSSGPQLRINRPGGLDNFASRLLPRPALLRQRLAATGTPLSIGAYGLICVNVGVAALVIALLRHMPFALALLIGTAAGMLLPHMVVGWLVRRRRAKFMKLFPDAIGLMVRGLKAGLPATESMVVVAREVPNPVGEEFRRATDQIRVGQGIEDSMWAVARRLQLPEFNFLVITLSIQRETGGNLGETLENLDDMLRKRHQMKLKVKAMSAEAMATAMIIGALPFVMSGLIFLVARNYIMTLFITTLGQIMLVSAATWMAIGFIVMAQMVRFEI